MAKKPKSGEDEGPGTLTVGATAEDPGDQPPEQSPAEPGPPVLAAPTEAAPPELPIEEKPTTEELVDEFHRLTPNEDLAAASAAYSKLHAENAEAARQMEINLAAAFDEKRRVEAHVNQVVLPRRDAIRKLLRSRGFAL